MSARAQCTEISAACPVEATLYGYYPNLSVNSFFAALFGLLCITQILLGTWRRTWTFMLALVLGTVGEAIGYAGRIIMHSNPWSGAGFKTQICCLVLAPSFLAAGIYLTMKHMVLYCGPEHSRLKPRLYPWIFISCDFGSLVLQALGGGVAAAADTGSRNGKKLLDIGDGLIVAGIAFQVATMAVGGGLMADFFWRVRRSKQSRSTVTKERVSSGESVDAGLVSSLERDKMYPKIMRRFRIFCFAIVLAYTTILIRCIYRLPEMAGGWGNPLMRKENEFLLLDGMMIGIACVAFTVCHPGFFFEPMRRMSAKK